MNTKSIRFSPICDKLNNLYLSFEQITRSINKSQGTLYAHSQSMLSVNEVKYFHEIAQYFDGNCRRMWSSEGNPSHGTRHPGWSSLLKFHPSVGMCVSFFISSNELWHSVRVPNPQSFGILELKVSWRPKSWTHEIGK